MIVAAESGRRSTRLVIADIAYATRRLPTDRADVPLGGLLVAVGCGHDMAPGVVVVPPRPGRAGPWPPA